MSFRFLFNFLTDYAQPIRRLVGNAGQQGDAVVCGGVEDGGICRRNPSGRGNAVRPYTKRSAVGNCIAHLYVFQRTEIRPRAAIVSTECYVTVPDGSTVYMACAFSHAFIGCTGINVSIQLAITNGDSAEVAVSADQLCLCSVAAAASSGTSEPVE